jgi:serine/threonine protein kinase
VFELLRNINHPGILSPIDYIESELGPALIFDHDTDAIRLDHYLERYRTKLSVDTRMHLMRQIADAVRYAHSKKIVHRALSPQSILVYNPGSVTPGIKIFDWQTGYRMSGSGGQCGGARWSRHGASLPVTGLTEAQYPAKRSAKDC